MAGCRSAGSFFLVLVAVWIVGPGDGLAWPQTLPPQLAEQALKTEEIHFKTNLDERKKLSAGRIIAKLAETPRGQAGDTVITEVTLLGSPGTSVGPPQRIMVGRYEYATGITWQTIIDLKTKEVVGFKAESNRPTPLGETEIKWATEIASDVFPILKSNARPKVVTLTVIQRVESEPRYGHRLVAIWPDVPIPKGRVLVDLTTGQIVNRSY